MKSFIYILLAVWALGFCEWAIGAEMQLNTAGATYADPQPYYKGSK